MARVFFQVKVDHPKWKTFYKIQLKQYHIDSSNDLSYNNHFAYKGLPNVVLPNLT